MDASLMCFLINILFFTFFLYEDIEEWKRIRRIFAYILKHAYFYLIKLTRILIAWQRKSLLRHIQVEVMKLFIQIRCLSIESNKLPFHWLNWSTFLLINTYHFELKETSLKRTFPFRCCLLETTYIYSYTYWRQVHMNYYMCECAKCQFVL